MAGSNPEDQALTMSAANFRTAFRNQLLVPHPALFAHDTCSSCGKAVDLLGVNMQKCKKEGKLTNQTYNNVLACVAEMARSCGLCSC